MWKDTSFTISGSHMPGHSWLETKLLLHFLPQTPGKQNHMKMAVLTKTCTRAEARKRNCQFVSSVGNNPAPLGKLRQKKGTGKATTKQLTCLRVYRSITPSFSLLFLGVKQGIIYPCMGNMYMPTVPKAQSINGLRAQAGTLPPHRPSVSPAPSDSPSQTSSMHTQTGSILVTTKAFLLRSLFQAPSRVQT